jgi:PAS domain S-box-containing protein
MSPEFHPDDLMLILDGIEDAVVKVDGHAIYVAMNQAAGAIFRRLGRDPEQMIGKSIWDVFPEVKGTIDEREITRALSEHMPVTFETYLPLDQRWYEVQGYPTREDLLLIFRDITARKSQP